MDDDQKRSYYQAVGWLWEAGLRFRSVIDLGCADGHFFVQLCEMGPFRGSTALNIDAQEDYCESLASIQATLGGHFRICAVGERDGGSVQLQRGGHPYWSSLRPDKDRYWATMNDLRPAESVSVPLRSIDSLVAETGLPGPYLIKLDVQGAETQALAGAERTLADTHAVVIETMLEDFSTIHEALVRNGFDLFDITDMKYTGSGVLGWFYAVYLHSRHRGLRPPAYWEPSENAGMIANQEWRRNVILDWLAGALERYRAGKWPPLSE